jgi:hypothetical protein
VKLLVQRGANLKIQDIENHDVMDMAQNSNNSDVISFKIVYIEFMIDIASINSYE